MRTPIKALIWAIVLAAIVYGGYRGLRAVRERREAASATAREKDTAPVTVAVVRVRRGRIARTIWATGEVRPTSSVEVVPEVTGRLERLRLSDGTPIEEGVTVKKGDVVAVIERDRYEAAVRSAEAAVAVAKAAYERAKVGLADARREKERWAALVAGGAGTQQQLDRAVTVFEQAQAELQAARAQIQQAEAALEQARVNLDEATIEAPLSGVVSRKYVDEGAFVGPGTPLFKVVDISQAEITGGVADRHYPELKIMETPAEVEVDAYPGEKFLGRVSRLRPEMDRATRTVAVTICVPNEDGRLKPGMYARTTLTLEEREDALLVPDEALYASPEGTRAYVVNDGVVHIRPVKIGLEEGNMNEVLEGLEEGEMVVVRGHALLREGMAVETREVDTP